LDLFVGVLDDLPVLVVDVSDWQRMTKLTPPRWAAATFAPCSLPSRK
jgi:hypothetical protein